MRLFLSFFYRFPLPAIHGKRYKALQKLLRVKVVVYTVNDLAREKR